MTKPVVTIAKLNDQRYEVSLENDDGKIKCYVRAKLPGPQLPSDERERERKQLALKRARALARALRYRNRRNLNAQDPKGQKPPLT